MSEKRGGVDWFSKEGWGIVHREFGALPPEEKAYFCPLADCSGVVAQRNRDRRREQAQAVLPIEGPEGSAGALAPHSGSHLWPRLCDLDRSRGPAPLPLPVQDAAVPVEHGEVRREDSLAVVPAAGSSVRSEQPLAAIFCNEIVAHESLQVVEAQQLDSTCLACGCSRSHPKPELDSQDIVSLALNANMEVVDAVACTAGRVDGDELRNLHSSKAPL